MNGMAVEDALSGLCFIVLDVQSLGSDHTKYQTEWTGPL